MCINVDVVAVVAAAATAVLAFGYLHYLKGRIDATVHTE